jgi:hypothetical protein
MTTTHDARDSRLAVFPGYCSSRPRRLCSLPVVVVWVLLIFWVVKVKLFRRLGTGERSVVIQMRCNRVVTSTGPRGESSEGLQKELQKDWRKNCVESTTSL